MLIRDQSRCVLYNLQACEQIYIEKCGRVEWRLSAYLNGKGFAEMARYNSKNRAIEVLDGICARYDAIKESVFLGMEESGFVGNIFEMPEE